MKESSSKKTLRKLPEGPLVAWYGDDFTGAAAVMEVLAFAGLPSILFLDVPTREQLDRFPDIRNIGVASTARARSPQWMSETLPAAFDQLKGLGPQLVHYKVCSTLDSSPDTGSIGRAIEIGAERFNTTVVPVLIAVPQMRRYQCFGHLFASAGDSIVRLDRHPVMSRHPVTPMTEADVSLHISKQSDKLNTGLLSLEDLKADETVSLSGFSDGNKLTAVTIDSLDAATDAAAGRAIWEAREESPFVVGSQGIEFALVEYWRQNGLLPATSAPAGIGRSRRMATVSGSVSPTTADQIAWSRANGFACIEFNAVKVCGGPEELEAEIEQVVERSLAALSQGTDPLIFSAAGPDDPAVERFRQAVAASALDMPSANRKVGEALGHILKRVLERGDVRRAVVSGGDTSGYATQLLDIFALSALAPTIPGASIFQAHADGPMDGLELALKGGQMGTPDYFGWVRDGGGPR
ncbi:four-carbon acid sugar kinase family protein [uncultured Roseibium sp.]|uniref:four-carbon acid sugar kinase family protein n=1 Tax=uncultured Roseibium sp. TaxID=1936171 RepID=UPI002629A846|nr:four-carbon acid sugar kinase family protein [uncultured Roseibium sp.]